MAKGRLFWLFQVDAALVCYKLELSSTCWTVESSIGSDNACRAEPRYFIAHRWVMCCAGDLASPAMAPDSCVSAWAHGANAA